jgi:hypothetical protein
LDKWTSIHPRVNLPLHLVRDHHKVPVFAAGHAHGWTVIKGIVFPISMNCD